MASSITYSKSVQVVAALGLAAVLVGIWLVKGAPILDGISAFTGPDSYMRVVRVEWWMAEGGWYDTLLPASNAPYGEVLHWTRPLDVVLASTTRILALFVDSKTAMVIAAAAVSPVFMVAAALVMGIALRPVVSGGGFLLFAILLATQPVTVSYTGVGRPDHHAMLLFFYAAVIAIVLRILMEPEHYKLARWAGVAGGFGIWVATEALLGIAVGFAILGTGWLYNGDRRLTAAMGQLAIVMTLGLLVAIPLERPSVEWLEIEYDRLSFGQLILCSLLIPASYALHWLSIRGDGPRLVTRVVAAGIVSFLVLVIIYSFLPGFFTGPMAALDPRLKPIWFDHVKELQPFFPASQERLGDMVLIMGPGVMGGLYMVWLAKTGNEKERRFAFGFIFLWVTFSILALYQARWAMYMGFQFAVPWAVLLSWVWRAGIGVTSSTGKKIPLRVPLFLTLLFWHIGVWAILSPSGEATANGAVTASKSSGCRNFIDPAAAIRAEAEKRGGPAIVMANIDWGPEIAYFSGQRIVSGPYHRNTQGILDVYDFFSATDYEKAKAIAVKRKIDLVLVCGQPKITAEDATRKDLRDSLRGGTPPDWLTQINIPTDTGEIPFKLYTATLPR